MCLRLFRQQAVTVDNRAGYIDELAVCVARLVAQHLEGTCFVDRVALHQDALGTLGNRAPPERAFEVVILGKAALRGPRE